MTITPIHRIGQLLASAASQFGKYNAKLLSHDVIQHGTIQGFVDNVTGVTLDRLYVMTHKAPVGSPVSAKRLFYQEGFANQFIGFFGANCVLGNGTTGTAPVCLYYNRTNLQGTVDASCLSNLNHTASTVTNTRYYLAGANPPGVIQHSVVYSLSTGTNTFTLAYSKDSIIELDWVFITSTGKAFRSQTDLTTGGPSGITAECYVDNSSQLIVTVPAGIPTVRVTILRKA
jgi:hypothetical protein